MNLRMEDSLFNLKQVSSFPKILSLTIHDSCKITQPPLQWFRGKWINILEKRRLKRALYTYSLQEIFPNVGFIQRTADLRNLKGSYVCIYDTKE